jgi:hypothetical protein
LFFTLGALSFHDARPGGNCYIDYFEGNECSLDDLVSRLRFWKRALCLDTAYVRRRMMKTHIFASGRLASSSARRLRSTRHES